MYFIIAACMHCAPTAVPGVDQLLSRDWLFFWHHKLEFVARFGDFVNPMEIL